MSTVFCRGCAKEIHESAISCPFCGAVQHVNETSPENKKILPAFLLCFFLGILGIHRFYAGKIGTGILQLLLTVTIIGMIISVIWALVDLIMIICGIFTDGQGNKITQWT